MIRTIKKYSNRKLYDTLESRYVTLKDLVNMIKNDVSFKVIDNKTKDTITKDVLINALTYCEKLNTSKLIGLIKVN